MGNPVVHFEIAGKDGKKLQDFYGKVFDWKIKVDEAMGGYGVVEVSEGGIGGGIMSTDDKTPNYVTFYVQVDDLQACLDKIGGLGGSTIIPPTPIPNVGSFAMFTDPEGNTVGIFKE